MAVFLYAPIMLQCMSPLVMLCTAPSPARECHESGCCLLQRMSPSLCRFLGRRNAPRHEIAGCGAATGQRALWGFDRGVRLEEFGSKRPTRSRCVKAWAYVQG